MTIEVDIPFMTPNCACKVCGANAALYGVVDFTKSCAEPHVSVQMSGIPIYYYQCSACRFLFTRAFDKWTLDDFNRNIYNDSYVMFDPDFVEARPNAVAQALQRMLRAHKGKIHGLDYGGGNGHMARLMRDHGYDFSSWDPVNTDSSPPAGTFNVVTAVEVAEHVPDPHSFFATIDRYLSQQGICIFTTALLESADTDNLMRWWYSSPLNGHISLYSRSSIEYLCRQYGLQVHIGPGQHVLYRQSSALLTDCLAGIFSPKTES